jgi:hypothetical protein
MFYDQSSRICWFLFHLIIALSCGTVALTIFPAAANAQTTNWTNAAGGIWGTASNWSAGVPVAAGTANFNLGSTYTVSLEHLEKCYR